MKQIYLSYKQLALIYFLGGVFIIILNFLLSENFTEINFIVLLGGGLCIIAAFTFLFAKRKLIKEVRNPQNLSTQEKMEMMIKNGKKLSNIFLIMGVILILTGVILLFTSSIRFTGFISFQMGIFIFIVGLILNYRIKQILSRNKSL